MHWICVRKSADRIYRIPCYGLDSSGREQEPGWEYNPSSINSDFTLKAGASVIYHNINMTLYKGENIY